MGLLLKCENVDFGYENQDAVVGVSMEVHTGDYICIVGENGSGKSTLMKGILGLLKPTGGRIEVSDELKRAGIGYLPQQTEAQKDFPATVFEAVRGPEAEGSDREGAVRHGSAPDSGRADHRA